MTLYAFRKSWQISPNNALAASVVDVATTNKTAILNLFNAITGAGAYDLNSVAGASTFTWYDTDGNIVASPAGFATIRYTSNSTTVSALGVNNITTPSHVVTSSGGARTWAIFDFVAIGVEIMIACDSATINFSNISVVASPYGVTGNRFAVGTTTANPATPVGGYAVLSNTSWGGSATVNAAIKIHVWVSTDGEIVEFMTANGGKFNTIFRVEKPIVSSTAWTAANYVFFKGAAANTSVCTVALWHTALNLYAYAAGAAVQFGLTMPYFAGVNCCASQVAVNGVSGAWDMFQQGIGKGANPAGGEHGEMNDVWWCSSTIGAGQISQASSPYPAGRLWCIGDQLRPGVPGIDCLTS